MKLIVRTISSLGKTGLKGLGVCTKPDAVDLYRCSLTTSCLFSSVHTGSDDGKRGKEVKIGGWQGEVQMCSRSLLDSSSSVEAFKFQA